ncbi:MAG: hypothetical protein KA715_01395 [Xanthomonadaceae bacterium]|nr:hypothetical protein [Xanthomonadaceae bacterium]
MESTQNLYAKGEKSAAITDLKHLIQEVPLYLNAYTLLAEYQLADGDRTGAIVTLKSAVERAAPSLKSGLRRKLQTLGKQFSSHKNYSDFQQAIKQINDGNLGAAQGMLESVLKQEIDHEEVLLRLGEVYFLLNDLKKSIVYLERTLSLDSKNYEAASWLGRAYFLSGEIKKSEKTFRKIRWGSPELDEQSAIWWSEVLFSSRGKKSAIEFLEKQFDQFPKRVRVLVKCAEYRAGIISKNNEAQWQAKKELQLALSRFDDYASKELDAGVKTPFGINQLNLENLKKQIQDSMVKLDEKLKKLDEARP